jgi:hypothetical protein
MSICQLHSVISLKLRQAMRAPSPKRGLARQMGLAEGLANAGTWHKQTPQAIPITQLRDK